MTSDSNGSDPSPWVSHSAAYEFENPWFKVKTHQVTTPGGKPGIYGVIEIVPAVCIVAMNAQQELCMVREFRYPHQTWMWTLPIGASIGTDLLASAQRELAEETGYLSDDWTHVGSLRNLKGLSNHMVHTFLATNVTPGPKHIEHDEAINGQRFISIADFFEEVRRGSIDDNESVGPLAQALAYLKRL